MILAVFTTSYSQEEIITKSFTTSSIQKIDFTKIYNKNTGGKITEKEFLKIAKKINNYNLEHVIDENGNITKYLLTQK